MVKDLLPKIKLCIFLGLVLMVILFFQKILYFVGNSESIILDSGIYAPIFFMLMMILFSILPVPLTFFSILGGVLFGPVYGTIYTIVAATIGAILALLVSRFFLRDFFKNVKLVQEYSSKINSKGNHHLIFIIFLARLNPVISFHFVNYAAGITDIKIFTYVWVTFLGMIPAVLVENIFGYALKPYITIVMVITIIVIILYVLFSLFFVDKYMFKERFLKGMKKK